MINAIYHIGYAIEIVAMKIFSFFCHPRGILLIPCSILAGVLCYAMYLDAPATEEDIVETRSYSICAKNLLAKRYDFWKAKDSQFYLTKNHIDDIKKDCDVAEKNFSLSKKQELAIKVK